MTLPSTPTTDPTASAAGAVQIGQGTSSGCASRGRTGGAGCDGGPVDVSCGGGTLGMLRRL